VLTKKTGTNGKPLAYALPIMLVKPAPQSRWARGNHPGTWSNWSIATMKHADDTRLSRRLATRCLDAMALP
jgi:hypothetical protein